MEDQADAMDVTTQTTVAPRLTIVLHPNPSRIDIALNDRRFNGEKYSFSRKEEAKDEEKALLDYCETYIVGVDGAKSVKNTLQLEVADGVLLREFLPQVVIAVQRWGSSVEPYAPEVYVDNRRYAVPPRYDRDGYTTSDGIPERPDEADIGIPFKVWIQGK